MSQKPQKIQYKNTKKESDDFNLAIASYYLPKIKTTQNFSLSENSVKQPNDFSRALYKCSGMAQKMFVVVMTEFMRQQKTRKDRWVAFDLSDALTCLNLVDGSDTRSNLRRANEELSTLVVTIQDDEHIQHFLSLFEEVYTDWDTRTAKFKLTEKFATFLEIEHKRGFTIFSVKLIGKLSSFYAMRYYQIAMSFYGFKGHCRCDSAFLMENKIPLKNSWFFAYSVEELRMLFGMKKKEYEKTQDLIRWVINAPIAELNEKIPSLKFNVEIKRKNNTQKGKIMGFIFWITEKTEVKKLAHVKNESLQKRQEVNAVNTESDFFNSHQEELSELIKKMSYIDALSQVAKNHSDEWLKLGLNPDVLKYEIKH